MQDQHGYPFGSMVDFACDAYGSPIIAISSLAVHTEVYLTQFPAFHSKTTFIGGDSM